MSRTPTSRPGARGGRKQQRTRMRRTSLFAHGEPMIWLTGGALALALCMVAGLLVLVCCQGGRSFWPQPVVLLETQGGAKLLGELAGSEPERGASAAADQPGSKRRLVRIGNFELTGNHYQWVRDSEVASESEPPWALVLERQTWGRFYGVPAEFVLRGEVQATEPEAVWKLYEKHHPGVLGRARERERLKHEETGRINQRLEQSRLELREIELERGVDSSQWQRAQAASAEQERAAQDEFGRIRSVIEAIDEVNARYQMTLVTGDGVRKTLRLDEIVRAYPANQLGFSGKLGIYADRWGEFLTDDPREANSEGGVFPALFGTVAMTLIMSLIVAPFGVLAALYLREYARPGLLVSCVRIAINNLAGVPSVVFGVFGLGFFCYVLGASIDQLFYASSLPNPTFGKGGLLWASLTLALLTLPVVIVPTEEALAAVPGSMREGSYACGATQWQTIRRIVLPRAMPGIMTGMILALARGAGEVAPLMLVGAAKLAAELPIDTHAPFVHPERSFMHLGFHIFDLGFQSQNSEASRPMVYTTTLLLIALVTTLNLLAIWIRARLRRRFQGVTI
jgi:phosphate transport system permease protein